MKPCTEVTNDSTSISIEVTYDSLTSPDPGDAGYTATTAVHFTSVYSRVRWSQIRERNGNLAAYCSHTASGLTAGEYALSNYDASVAEHEGAVPHLDCCPCRPSIALLSHTLDSSPAPIGTVSFLWNPGSGGDPDPHSETDHSLFGYATIQYTLGRCREALWHPGAKTYSTPAPKQDIFIGPKQIGTPEPGDGTGRNAEYIAVVGGDPDNTTSGAIFGGTFVLKWKTPQELESPHNPPAYIKITATKDVSSLTDPIASPTRWVATIENIGDETFDVDSLQITQETNGIRIGFIGEYGMQSIATPELFEDPTDPADSTDDYNGTIEFHVTGLLPQTAIVTIFLFKFNGSTYDSVDELTLVHTFGTECVDPSFSDSDVETDSTLSVDVSW